MTEFVLDNLIKGISYISTKSPEEEYVLLDKSLKDLKNSIEEEYSYILKETYKLLKR